MNASVSGYDRKASASRTGPYGGPAKVRAFIDDEHYYADQTVRAIEARAGLTIRWSGSSHLCPKLSIAGLIVLASWHRICIGEGHLNSVNVSEKALYVTVLLYGAPIM